MKAEQAMTSSRVTIAAAQGKAIMTALAGMLGFILIMGFGRFAYTAILPLMIREGSVTVHGGSLLATVNLAGYLVGALSGMAAGERSRPMLLWGMVLTALGLIGMGMTGYHPAWQGLRFLSGVASAWGLVGITHWSMRRLVASGHGHWRGIVFSGPGFGIMITGLLVPMMAGHGMRVAGIWLWLGILAAFGGALVLAASWRENMPVHPPIVMPLHIFTPASGPQFRLPKAMLAVAYGISGACYIVPATFLPLIAREVLPGGGLDQFLWPVMGLMAGLSTILCGFVPPRHHARTLVLVYLCEAVGIVIPVFLPSLAGLALSSVLVGSTMMLGVMLSMDAAKNRYHDPSLVAMLTAGYAAGQVVGPYMAGTLYQYTHSFLPSLAVAGAWLALSALLSVLEPMIWGKRRLAMDQDSRDTAQSNAASKEAIPAA
ncbi:Transporter, MFS superfamily [Granulibacter bethesdensis]|uniref:Transporter, MFS superfamily n=2 Tax=Granulibacter bethesdensis TaxID=364410 RepID=Q0BS44_GRABC|nr:Transporter, MFS superfamily [Granulibacter bethesdensis CGDNIH1]AHJ68721.1 Transporter, MFS superfamily [Granulibacter bethesdensis]APH52188.1 Transporter, MFS superfamily [Granulibacter bethesdensis]APH64881.1 Transporter, MFS superfamily [Granulibacter bethesdensis]